MEYMTPNQNLSMQHSKHPSRHCEPCSVQLALKLEGAETALIRKAKKKQMEMQKKQEKLEGKQHKKMTRTERKKQNAEDDAIALDAADQAGISSGDPHQAHTKHETLGEESREGSPAAQEQDRGFGIQKIGQFGQDIDRTVRGGLGLVTGFGKKFVDDVRHVPRKLDTTIDHAYEGTGFSFDGQREPLVDRDEISRGRPLSTRMLTRLPRATACRTRRYTRRLAEKAEMLISGHRPEPFNINVPKDSGDGSHRGNNMAFFFVESPGSHSMTAVGRIQHPRRTLAVSTPSR